MTLHGLSILATLFLMTGSSSAFSVQLKDNLLYEWNIDYDQSILLVKVTYRPDDEDILDTKDWIAIGFSDYGEFNQADFCIFAEDTHGNLILEDAHTGLNDTIAKQDAFNDCKNFRIEFNPDTYQEISWHYTREFDTSHKLEDYLIEDGTTHLLWAVGKGPIFGVDGLDLVDSESTIDHGFVRLRLLKVDVDFTPPDDAVSLEVKHKILVPADDTTYWCSVHKLPKKFNRKHHVIQYEPTISHGNDHLIHHMEVFHCVPEIDGDDFPMWEGPCGSDDAPPKLARCKKVLAAWAIGAGPFVYPEEAGLAVGGENFSPYIMLEVHINNEKMESGVKDESGIKFLVTEKLRQEDAGIMELGLIYNDYMAIPPGQFMFPLRGFCLPECTEKGLPKTGITIFGSQLHTHGTGLRVATEHFRDGLPLPDVNRDNHYSTHFQEIRELHEPRRIMPGDELVTSCYYDTRKKSNATVGGFGFSEEMCVNYVHYFPRTENLEICKSSVDHHTLQGFFFLLNEWIGENTDPEGKSSGDNYKSIWWSQPLADVLESFYEASPVQMQCTTAAGKQLPGHWTQMEKPPLMLEEVNPYQKADAKQKGKEIDQVKKRAGKPFNEMKKRQGSSDSHGMRKREPVSKLKRPFLVNKYKNLANDIVRIPVRKSYSFKREIQKQFQAKKKKSDEIPDAKTILNEIEKLTRKKKMSLSGLRKDELEAILSKMEKQLEDAFLLIEELSSKDGIDVKGFSMQKKSSGLQKRSNVEEKKRSSSNQSKNFDNFWSVIGIKNRLPKKRMLNFPEEKWSDYDTWGIDKRKMKRLGSVLDDVEKRFAI